MNTHATDTLAWTYRVTLLVGGAVVAENYSTHALAPTLRLAWELLGGIPQAEVCVRRNALHGPAPGAGAPGRGPRDGRGFFAAWLKTDHRGELAEADVYSPVSPLVTPLNPQGPLFQGVFAR